MQIRARSYPHPVLAYFGDDVVGSAFQPTILVKPTKTSYTFEAIFKTSNRDLAAAVKTEEAANAVHVECATTRYRSLFSSNDERFTFEIPASMLDGRVELCSFILARKDRRDYKIGGFHADYANMTFSVRKADTLAVGADHIFVAEKKIDPLRKIPSIFVITQNDADDAPAIDIDLSGEKISVSLSKQNYEAYRYLSKSQAMHAVLCSIVIIPALVSIIESLRHSSSGSDEFSTYESRRWYAVLGRRLKEVGINIQDAATVRDSSLLIAQKLVGNPLTGGLVNLQSYEQDAE